MLPATHAGSNRAAQGERDAMVRLAHLDEQQSWLPYLDAGEARQARERSREVMRARFVVSRGLRRKLLAGCTGRAPGELEFIEQPGMKPRLADPCGWDFNLSHAGDYVAVAAGRGPVGIDLERMRPVREMASLVRRYFHTDECAAWEALADERREVAFFVLWSAREAAMKCAGMGLAKGSGVTRVDPLILESVTAAANVAAVSLTLRRFEAPAGYVLVLARG